jgi:hypothetical protein
MKERWCGWSARAAVSVFSAFFCLSAAAHEPEQTIPVPGFRPPSDLAQVFLDDVGDMSIDVLPSVVRRFSRTAHSFSSQQLIVDSLNENRLGTASVRHDRVDLGPLLKHSQWELFQEGLAAVSEAAANRDTGADYTLLMEFLVPGDESVFGVEVYIVDAEGRNAFSFLLNSHHQMFAEAGLVAQGSSEAARERMIENATRLGLRALQDQIRDVRECVRRAQIAAPALSAGTLHDFDAPLVAGNDERGTELGYSAFSGPDTSVNFATTDTYPPRADAKDGNRVLRIDLDVASWGGVIHRFTNETADQWMAYDWRDLDGYSFWFHGANSGIELFFDILDNRTLCSVADDAERFRYRFRDDVEGWRLIEVRLQDLVREDVFNGAPDDGLGLSKVHGWGIGTLHTDGPVTIYIDEFRLLGGGAKVSR